MVVCLWGALWHLNYILIKIGKIMMACQHFCTLQRNRVTEHSCMGALVAQLIKCLILDVSSGLDLSVMISSPALGSMLGPSLLEKKIFFQ